MRAREPHPHFEVLDGNRALAEVDVTHGNAKSFRDAAAQVKEQPDEELVAPIPEGQVMGGAPKMAVVGALADHTAHHRGSLAVYARLLGKTPADAIWG